MVSKYIRHEIKGGINTHDSAQKESRKSKQLSDDMFFVDLSDSFLKAVTSIQSIVVTKSFRSK